MKKIFPILLVLVICMFLNPSEDSHRNEIKNYVNSQATQSGLLGGVSSSLGLTDIAVDALPLEYNNYYLFSTTTIDGERLSYGLLGFVKVED